MCPSPILPTQALALPVDRSGESLGHLLSRVDAVLAQRLSQRTREALGVTGLQGCMLFMLSTGRCTTAAELAREYGVDASAATRMLDRVETRGLLSRVRDDGDRRITRLALTDEGRARAAAMPEIFHAVLDEALAGFTAEEAGFLIRLLARIRANGDGSQRRAGWPEQG